MKVALCYHGIAKGYNFKNGGLPVGFSHEFDLITQNLINCNKNYEFDIYLHSWSLDAKDEVVTKMKPEAYLFEKPKQFNKFSFLTFFKETIKKLMGKGYELQRKNNIYSRWYSFSQVCNLIKQSNKKYDLIIVTRFDMCLLNTLDLSQLNFENFYSGDWKGIVQEEKEILEEDYKHNNSNIKLINKGYPYDNEGLQDFFFISSPSYMIDSFSLIFNELKELIKKYGLSNHSIALGKLKEDNKLSSHKRILSYSKDYFLSRWL